MKKIKNPPCYLGDISVGKTAIIKYQIEKKFTQTENTIGAASYNIIIDGKELTVYDTAGQERYHSLIDGYVKGSLVIIIVFDITNKDSYESVLSDWANYISDKCDPFSILLVGNKIDLSDDRVISFNDGTKLSNQIKDKFYKEIKGVNRELDDKRFSYYETSAKDGTGIDILFHFIAEMASAAQSLTNTNSVEINKPDQHDDKCKC